MIADIGCHLDGISNQVKHKLLVIIGMIFLISLFEVVRSTLNMGSTLWVAVQTKGHKRRKHFAYLPSHLLASPSNLLRPWLHSFANIKINFFSLPT